MRSYNVWVATPWYIKARAALKAKGLRYGDVAERLGVQKSTVGHWMVGRNKADLETIKEIAKMTDKKASELIEDDPWFAMDEPEKTAIELVRQLEPSEKGEAIRLLEAFLSSRKSRQ